MRTRTKLAAVLLAALACAFAGCRHNDTDKRAGSGSTPSYLDQEIETAQAIVETVYPTTRQITLRIADEGFQMHTFVAGPEVKNFDRIRKGDRVEAQYYEALAVSVQTLRSGIARNTNNQGILRTAKSAGKVARLVTLTGSVARIDREKSVIVLRNSSGNRRFVKVPVLDELNVGDEVYILHTEPKVIGLKELE